MRNRAKYDIPPQFLTAETRRQKILDYLNANPGMRSADIDRHFAEVHEVEFKSTNTTRQMLDMGELSADQTNSNSYRYYATVSVTISARVVSERQKQASREMIAKRNGKPVPKPKAEPSGPGYYRHEPGVYPGVPGHLRGLPLRNQEAQGSGRARVWVGSAMV